MDTPCVLITSCSDFSCENIIRGILQVDSLPAGQVVLEQMICYNWSVDTKYYTADVKLCLTKQRTIGDQRFADNVQAFVVYFDADKKVTFDSMKLWHPYLKQIQPEVKLLVCDHCTENSEVDILTVQTWCIDNGFELVELCPEPVSDGELEDDFLETTGITRIIQSLHAHAWPNLRMKDSRHSVSPYMRTLMNEEHESQKLGAEGETSETHQFTARNNCETVSEVSEDKEEKLDNFKCYDECNTSGRTHSNVNRVLNVTNCSITGDTADTPICESYEKSKEINGATGNNVQQDKMLDDSKENTTKTISDATKEERLDPLLPSDNLQLFEAIGTEDPDGESFEKLFEKFARMKVEASALPLQERKKYAENVAIAFWKAIGGSDDEIGDLDD